MAAGLRAASALTYGELDARANRLAHHLRALGRRARTPGRRLCMERSLEMSSACSASSKAGGAYVPLDPTYPPERLAFMLARQRAAGAADAAAPARAAAASCRGRGLAPRRRRRAARAVAGDGATRSRRADPASNLAYIIYTSGSTGRPKGVMIHHAAWSTAVAVDAGRLYGSERGHASSVDDLAQLRPRSGVLLAAAIGARVVHRPQAGAAGPARRALDAAARSGRHDASTEPAHARASASRPAGASAAALRRVICGGEALPPASAGALLEAPGAELINTYGPTETVDRRD